MEIIKTRKEFLTTDWSEVEAALELAAKGESQTVLMPFDQIIVEHEEYGEITMDVIDTDRDIPVGSVSKIGTLTLQFHELILPPMAFDKGGSSIWKDSGIRRELNSDEFIDGFEGGFRKLLKTVKKDTDGVKTEDTFFLLSRDEVGATDNDLGRYAFYNASTAFGRVKVDAEGETDWHWLRSAYRGYAYYAWSVYSSGYVGIYNAYGAGRCAPACVIARP